MLCAQTRSTVLGVNTSDAKRSIGHGHGLEHGHGPVLARLLDLDAEVHARLLDDALSLAVTLAGSGSVARVVDVGAGTGAGTFALARRFPSAEVVALDRDPGMLELLRGRASAACLDDRVSTVLADIAAAARTGIPGNSALAAPGWVARGPRDGRTADAASLGS